MDQLYCSPLLSIVIPTKDRSEYLIGCLESIAGFDSKQVEVVIQDNSEDNSVILKYLEQKNNPLFKYHYDNSRSYSQTENSELATEKARGEFVCFIGDDDSVPLSLLDVVKWMHREGIESVSGIEATYWWPGLKSKQDDSRFFIPKCSYNIERVDLKSMLNTIARDGGLMNLKLRGVYHGIVSKEALERLKAVAGSYYPGPSPDMANAVGLGFVLRNHVFIDAPIILNGFGKRSAGGLGANKKHSGALKDVEQLPRDIECRWRPEIPRYWLGETIYCQSAIEASMAVGNPSFIKSVNYSNLYARIVLLHPECCKYVRECITSLHSWLSFSRGVVQVGLEGIGRKARKRLAGWLDVDITGLDSLNEARIMLDEFLHDRQIRFDMQNTVGSLSGNKHSETQKSA